MSITLGARVYKNINRPSGEAMKQFEGIPSSNIGDYCNRLYCSNGTLRAFNDKMLLGPAFTVKVPAGDNLLIHLALDLAQEGDVLVIDGAGMTDRSLLGEMMIIYAEKRKLGGIVVDGAIRDSDYASRAGIPIYAAGVTPQGPYKNGPGEINVPVCCAGQVVMPGDIIAGDADGIVVIHPEQVDELAAIAQKKMAGEIEQRGTTADGSYLIKHREQFEKATEKAGVILLDEAFQQSRWG